MYNVVVDDVNFLGVHWIAESLIEIYIVRSTVFQWNLRYIDENQRIQFFSKRSRVKTCWDETHCRENRREQLHNNKR